MSVSVSVRVRVRVSVSVSVRVRVRVSECQSVRVSECQSQSQSQGFVLFCCLRSMVQRGVSRSLSSLISFKLVSQQLHMCFCPVEGNLRMLRTLDLGGNAIGSRVTFGVLGNRGFRVTVVTKSESSCRRGKGSPLAQR